MNFRLLLICVARDFGIKTISRINFFIVSYCIEKVAARRSVRNLRDSQKWRGISSVELILSLEAIWWVIPGPLCCAASELLRGIHVGVHQQSQKAA